MRHFVLSIIYMFAGCSLLSLTVACNDVLDGLYDDPQQVVVTEGQLYIDATSWTNWYYVDFDSLQALKEQGDSLGLIRAQTHFTPWPVPMEAVDTTSSAFRDPHSAFTSGIYTYWFDVFGKGLSNNREESFRATAPQPEPDHWSLAIHRDNVRTNDGEVLETNYTSLKDLPPSSNEFTSSAFTPDTLTQNAVWVDNSTMLQSLIGCQHIAINPVLSEWLHLDIPPMPPAFTMNSHVFLIRFKNNKYAAVQLVNYMNEAGTKCWLTINYKYPY